MTEQTIKPMRETRTPPIQLYQHVFCKNCQNHCNPTETLFQNCVLAFLSDELTRIRQLLQQRIQT